jgi:three-Cys-motif partner protein
VEDPNVSEYLSTVWPADPHTLAKHRILAGYLQAWMPILARNSEDTLFIDGFAGPGQYEGGEPGSPVIAMNVAIEHVQSFPTPVTFLFIEQDKARYEHLVKVIESQQPKIAASPNIRLLPPEQGDCQTVIGQLLADRDAGRRAVGPILAFLDQFGYSDVTIELIARIMARPKCEVFSYMDWRFMNAFMTDGTKWPAITKAFGDDSWKPCLQARGKAREQVFLDLYIARLRQAANSKYVWNFAMCGEGGQLLYWLFFCTNSLKGLEEMKKAMWGVDDKGSFRFSDGDDPNQLALSIMTKADASWLSTRLHKKFLGAKIKVGSIKEYVLVETPRYRFKDGLKILEDDGRLRAIVEPGSKRKKGSFSDDEMEVEFVTPPLRARQGVLF